MWLWVNARNGLNAKVLNKDFLHILSYLMIFQSFAAPSTSSCTFKNHQKCKKNFGQLCSTFYPLLYLFFRVFFFLIWYSRNLYFTMHNYPLGVYYLSSGSKCSIQKDALVTNENPSLPDWFQIGPIQLLVYPFTK